MKRRVLFAGDANADLVLSGLAGAPREDREVFCELFTATLGGSTTIAAAAYARLGGRSEFCGLVGSDEYGRLVAAALADAGVGLRLLRRSKAERTGVTVNLVRASTRTQVTYPGTLASVDESGAIIRSLRGFSHLHISGVFGMPRFLPKVAGVLAAAREAGLSTSVDTQWDPSEEWRYVDEWLPSLSYLFVNEDEARSLARRLRGFPARDEAEAWAVLAEKTACPIVKLGPRGAYAAGRPFPAFSVKAIDPTGAGDTFAAGFIFAVVEEGLSVEGAISFAQAAGALACTYTGGASPSLSAERVREMLR
jgi:ribokinase